MPSAVEGEHSSHSVSLEFSNLLKHQPALECPSPLHLANSYSVLKTSLECRFPWKVSQDLLVCMQK